jgi:hypothetical protein
MTRKQLCKVCKVYKEYRRVFFSFYLRSSPLLKATPYTENASSIEETFHHSNKKPFVINHAQFSGPLDVCTTLGRSN